MKTQDRYKWVVLALFWLAYFFNQADRQVLFTVFPLVKGELALSDVQLGLLGSSFFWMYALVVPVAGGLGDVLSRRKIIALALLAWSAATFCSALAAGFVLLMIFRAITGAAEAFYYPAANSMISDYHGQRTRALAMGIHQTSVYFGIVASGTLAGYIGQQYGWRTAFVAFGGVGFVLAVVIWKTLREPERGQSDREAISSPIEATSEKSWNVRLADSFRRPSALLLMGAFLGFKVVDAAYLAWMPTLLFRKFDLSLVEAGFHATFWHHVGAALGVLAGGHIADRWSQRTPLSRPLVQVIGLFGGAPFIFLLGGSESVVVVYASLGLFGIFRGLYDSNLFAALYEVIPPESRATATGTMLCGAWFGGGLAPLLIGFFIRRLTLGTALASTSVFYVVSGALILMACLFWFRRDATLMRQAFVIQGEPIRK